MHTPDAARTNPAPSGSDLDWLACRHLLGELDEAEMAAFAERLGADDEAVAALERASQLLVAIEATSPSEMVAGRVVRRDHSAAGAGRTRAAWLGIGAAGIAAAVAVAVLLSGPSAKPRGRTAELLALWQINADGVRDDAFWRADAVWDDGEPVEEVADAPPAWLLAAVTLEAGPSGRPDAAAADVIERN
jgi:hypothetical protein